MSLLTGLPEITAAVVSDSTPEFEFSPEGRTWSPFPAPNG